CTHRMEIVFEASSLSALRVFLLIASIVRRKRIESRTADFTVHIRLTGKILRRNRNGIRMGPCFNVQAIASVRLLRREGIMNSRRLYHFQQSEEEVAHVTLMLQIESF